MLIFQCLLSSLLSLHILILLCCFQQSHSTMSTNLDSLSLICPIHTHATGNGTSLPQFSSVAQSCPTLCSPMHLRTPGLPVHHQLPEFIQTYVHRVSDAIQPSHPLSSPSPPAPKQSQHQGLFQQVNSWHEVAKVLEFQLQHQSFQ